MEIKVRFNFRYPKLKEKRRVVYIICYNRRNDCNDDDDDLDDLDKTRNLTSFSLLVSSVDIHRQNDGQAKTTNSLSSLAARK